MKELIRIENQVIGTDEVNSVNARELWQILEIKQEFANWIKKQIKSLGLEENVDFISFDKKVKRGNGGTVRKEYIITTDTAKHISMASRTPKGKEVRNYFIEVEKLMRNDVNLHELHGRIGGLIKANQSYREQIEYLQCEIENQQRRIPPKKKCLLEDRFFGGTYLQEFIGAVQREQQDMGEILSMLVGHHKQTSKAMSNFLDLYPEINPHSKSNGYTGEFINININL